MEQRTIEWYRARLGRFTGSSVYNLMVAGRKKEDVFGVTAMSYIRKVTAQRLLADDVVDNDVMLEEYLELVTGHSKALHWGIEMEDEARTIYTDITGREVEQTGSVVASDMPYFAASPDGIIVSDEGRGVLEIKCSLDEKFVAYLEVTDAETLKAVEPRYYWQMMAEMYCTGTEWGDFVVYNPFMASPVHVARIQRNADDTARMIERVKLAEGVALRLEKLAHTSQGE